jgi:hypothetical protein
VSTIYARAHTLERLPEKKHQFMLFFFFYLFSRINGKISNIKYDSNQLSCLTYVAATLDNVIDSQLVAGCAIFAFKSAGK